jgi:hypothetical protein
MIFSVVGIAQNLVLNPSFEETDCNAETNEYFFPALGWYNASNSSPDLYTVSLNPGECYANQPTGGQTPRFGSFMAGIWGSQIDSPTREYIQSKLIEPMIEDSIYCIEVYILLAEFCPLAINRFGIQLSMDSLYDFSTSQVLTGGVLLSSPISEFLTDMDNWMYLTWEYQAVGGEEFVTLGNFWAETDLEYMAVEGSDTFPLAFYFVDDVSISKCNSTSLEEQVLVIFMGPNPFHNQLEISIGDGPFEWAIYDMDGREVKSGKMVQRGIIELQNLASGMYTIQIMDGQEKGHSRLICKQ